MKAYTDINQSKKLAEILPIESADMSWAGNGLGKPFARTIPCKGDPEEICPCWSLAALLAQMPWLNLDTSEDNHYRVFWRYMYSNWHESAVDACVELIERVNNEKPIDL